MNIRINPNFSTNRLSFKAPMGGGDVTPTDELLIMYDRLCDAFSSEKDIKQGQESAKTQEREETPIKKQTQDA